MMGGVYAVEAMGKNSDCLHIILKSSTMGANINAVSQSAHNDNIRKHGGEFAYKFAADVATVFCNATCADDAEHMLGVKVGIPAIEEGYGGVGTFFQPLWKGLGIVWDYFDVALLTIFHLLPSASQGLGTMGE